MAIRVQFLKIHVRDTVIILEEVNIPHPWFPWCNMLVPWKALNKRHITTSKCTKGVCWKRRWLVSEDMRERV